MSKKEQRTLMFFIELKKQWIERFSGDHENSVCQQLYDLTWYLTVFHVISESRAFSQDQEGKYKNNSMLHNFIDKCFLEYLFITLRRLLDKDRHKETCSLYRLIVDMENHCHLITRDIFFKAYDFEYDVEKVKKEYEEYFRNQKAKGIECVIIPHRFCWEQLEYRHSIFDKLSGVDKDSRKPTDCIKKSIFKGIRNKLDHYDDVMSYAHNFIAHLSRPIGQEKSLAVQIDPTLGRLCETHEVLCQVATFIGRFLEYPGPFSGTVVFDQFKNIDKPFVDTKNIEQLKEIWGKYSEKFRSWQYIDFDNYDAIVM